MSNRILVLYGSYRSDRMGIRLEGEAVETVKTSDIISDGIALGAIQVPSAGKPIILLADRQTTGGYAKIASVINVDMPMVAQCKAGDTLRFVKTDIVTAQDAFVAQKQKYKALCDQFDLGILPPPPEPEPFEPETSVYRLMEDGKFHDVTVTRIE